MICVLANRCIQLKKLMKKKLHISFSLKLAFSALLFLCLSTYSLQAQCTGPAGDCDGDGIADSVDDDDDGDGILDVDEGFCAARIQTRQWTVNGGTATYSYQNGLVARMVVSGGQTFSSGNFNSNGQGFWSENLAGATSLQNDFQWNETLTISFLDSSGNLVVVDKPIIHFDRIGGRSGDTQNSARITIQNAGVTWSKIAGTDDFLVTSTTVKDAGANSGSDYNYTAESSQDDRSGTAAGSLQINQSVSQITLLFLQEGPVGAGDGMEFIVFACKELDTDGDGIPDYQDLDSDNDGCGDSPNTKITGKVFNDANKDGTDDSESGVQGVNVKIYEDKDGDGTVSGGDNLVSTETTDANGNFSYTVTAGEQKIVADDFTGNVFSGSNNNSGDTNWANNSWIRDGFSGDSGDVQLTYPYWDSDFNFNDYVVQLDSNDAGFYRLIDLSQATSATLTFQYDNDDSSMDGGESLLVQIDPENDGTYTTIQTINSLGRNREIPVTSVSIDLKDYINLPSSANTRIRFVTGSSTTNRNGEDWWIANVAVTMQVGVTKFVVETDANSYPAGFVINTDNIETADFGNGACDDQGNSFGLYLPIADLSITKKVSNATPEVDDIVIYTIALKNSGPESATGVTVKDLLPVGVTYSAPNSTIPANTTYNSGTGIWDLSALTITKGQTITLKIAAKVVNTGQLIMNTTEIVTSNLFDNDSNPNSGN